MCEKSCFVYILVNGTPSGFFNSKRGLRQGWPLSPYLFAIIMESFSAIPTECASSGLIPTPFQKGGISISHLLYAVDVMLFAKASAPIAGNIKKFLDDFRLHSGLAINCAKSSILFFNCDEQIKKLIFQVLNISEKKPLSSILACHYSHVV